MTSYGNGIISPQSQAILATDYSYNWINLNEGPGFVPFMVATPVFQGTNAFYFTLASTVIKIWDGQNWVTPITVYDGEEWIPYGQVYDGTTWI